MSGLVRDTNTEIHKYKYTNRRACSERDKDAMMNGPVMDALGKDIKAGSTNGKVEFSK